MKIIDSNGRLFGKVSVIDLVAVLIVVIMAISVYGKFQNPITSKGNDKDITFQIQVIGLEDFYLSGIREGDELYDPNHMSDGVLGQIERVEASPGTRIAVFEDGTQEYIPMEDGYDLLVTVKCAGIVEPDGEIAINRTYKIGLNSSRNYRTKLATFTGTVVDLQVTDRAEETTAPS